MICSYLVIPEDGALASVAERLATLPGCDVVSAENRDVLILVTDTPGLEEEGALRRKVEALDGIQALLLTFGEIDPDAPIGDRVAIGDPVAVGDTVDRVAVDDRVEAADTFEVGGRGHRLPVVESTGHGDTRRDL